MPPPRGQPYCSELDVFVLGEAEAESKPRMADGSLEPSECRMQTMEPRQALTNIPHVENLDFLKVVLRPSQSDSNRAEEKGKSTH